MEKLRKTPKDLSDNIANLKRIYMSDSSLNMLMDFERVLDTLDIYTFPNWIKGELVDGPKISKYWVTCKFMWPYDMMPDPSGGKRLLPFGSRITYEKKTILVPVKISTPNDYRDGSKKGKLVETSVWYVEIMLPKNLMMDIKQGYVEIAGEEIDLNDLQDSFHKDLLKKSNSGGSAQAPQLEQPAGGPENAANF